MPFGLLSRRLPAPFALSFGRQTSGPATRLVLPRTRNMYSVHASRNVQPCMAISSGRYGGLRDKCGRKPPCYDERRRANERLEPDGSKHFLFSSARTSDLGAPSPSTITYVSVSVGETECVVHRRQVGMHDSLLVLAAAPA